MMAFMAAPTHSPAEQGSGKSPAPGITRNHWKDYYRAWSQLTPPLRPHPQVVAAVAAEIGDTPGRTLLLGVTPELADIADDLVAVDRNYSLVSHVWPGNTQARRAMVGDWLNTNFTPGSFTTCLGDGSLSVVEFPRGTLLLCERIYEALRSGGRFVGRVYLAPEPGETVATVKAAAGSGAIRNFHAFKLRLAMAIAAEAGRVQVGVNEIFAVFQDLFGDRDELVRLTGWDRRHIDTIDYYENSSVAYSFPTRRQLLSVIPRNFANVRMVEAGTYELAERSPLLVMEKSRQ
jgi:SAM-dependent methyltransferase